MAPDDEQVSTLSPQYREVVLLVGHEGLTPSDAAAVCGISPEALRQRLSRARAALAERLPWVAEGAFRREIVPALGGAWCLAYLVEIVRRAAAIYGYFGPRRRRPRIAADRKSFESQRPLTVW